MQSVKTIARTFSRHIDTYDGQARIQHRAAQLLAGYLDQLGNDLPDGPLLEIGCGTGLMTREIVKRFARRHTVISDASPDMVSFCRTRLQLERGSSPSNVQFAAIDGQTLQQPGVYALIVSSFTFQWFTDLSQGIHNLLNCLKPGGKLVFSLPMEGSFPEWKQMCLEVSIPCTVNKLPDAKAIAACAWWHNYPCSMHEQDLALRYRSTLQFFHSLKELGAHTQTEEVAHSTSHLLRLIRHWDRRHPHEIDITYRVLYGSITRNR